MTQEGDKALAWNHWRLLRRSVTQDFKEFALLFVGGAFTGYFRRLFSPLIPQPYPLACPPVLKIAPQRSCASGLPGFQFNQPNPILVSSCLIQADLPVDAFHACVASVTSAARLTRPSNSRRSSARLGLGRTSKVRAGCRPLAENASQEATDQSQSSNSRPKSPSLSHDTNAKSLGAVTVARRVARFTTLAVNRFHAI